MSVLKKISKTFVFYLRTSDEYLPSYGQGSWNKRISIAAYNTHLNFAFIEDNTKSERTAYLYSPHIKQSKPFLYQTLVGLIKNIKKYAVLI